MAEYLHTMVRITDPQKSRAFYEALGFAFSRDMDIVRNGEVGLVAVCYAVGPLILARMMGGLPALGIVAASLGLSAVFYAPLAAFHWPARFPSAHVVESIVGLAVVCSAAAFLIFFALIREVGPLRATVITYVNPAVAAALGVTLLNERLTTGMVIGFTLVLAGCILATGGTPEAVAEP